MVNGTRSAESRLSELKTELAAVERKDTAFDRTCKTVGKPAEQAEKAGKSKGFRKYYQNERRSFATRRTVSTMGIKENGDLVSPRFFIKFRLLISSCSSIRFISASRRPSRNFCSGLPFGFKFHKGMIEISQVNIKDAFKSFGNDFNYRHYRMRPEREGRISVRFNAVLFRPV